MVSVVADKRTGASYRYSVDYDVRSKGRITPSSANLSLREASSERYEYFFKRVVLSVHLSKPSSRKLPKSNLQVEVSFRSGGLEIRTKGSISDLSKEISSISSFAELATSRLSGIVSMAGGEQATTYEEPTSVEAPVIRVSKSTPENIRALFETPWGKTPKTLDEVSKALEVNAVPDSAANIGVALIRHVKRGELRRIKKAGKWSYYRIPS